MHNYKWISAIIILILFSMLGFSACKNRKSSTPSTIKYTWRRDMPGLQVHHLAMAWNGSRMVIAATLDKKIDDKKGDLLAGIESGSRALRDWRPGGVVSDLSVDGDGSVLLTRLADGKIAYYADWQKKEKPRAIGSGTSVLLSPKGNGIALWQTAAKGKPDQIQVLSREGKHAWTFPAEVDLSWKAFFPFLRDERLVLGYSPAGTVVFTEGEKVIWKKELAAPVVAVASAQLGNENFGILLGGPKPEIRFFAGAGDTLGSAPLPAGESTLSCSDVGVGCAVLTNGPAGQHVAFYDPDGKIRWEHQEKTAAASLLPLELGGHGEFIYVILEKDGKQMLHCWDIKGNLLWTSPVEGAATAMKASWNGKRIAVLSHDATASYLAYYNLGDEKKGPAPK